jgi:hypothetical protein
METKNTILESIDSTVRKNPLVETISFLAREGIVEGIVNKFNVLNKPRISKFVEKFLRSRAVLKGNLYRQGEFQKNHLVKSVDLYFKLPDPFPKEQDILAFLIRTGYEQEVFLDPSLYVIGRSYYLFVKISKEIMEDSRQEIIQLEAKLGVNLTEYFRIIFVLYAVFHNFEKEKITKPIKFEMILNQFKNLEKSDTQKRLLFKAPQPETLQSIIDRLSITKEKYVEYYEQRNRKHHEDYIKYFFDPFEEYPLFLDNSTNSYIAVDSELFLRRSSNLFWDFDQINGNNFRKNFFGPVFQKYVFVLLQKIYPEITVEEGIKYRKNGSDAYFFDVVVEVKNKVYLFEVKANVINLDNKILGLTDKTIEERFVEKPVIQMFKRIQDLKSGKYPELEKFQNKELIPIAIFYDMPIEFHDFLFGKIRKILTSITDSPESRKKYLKGYENQSTQLKDFKYDFMKIQDLELYESVKDKIELHTALEDCKGNITENFISYLEKINGTSLDSPFLKKVYSEALSFFTNR